LLYLVEQIFRRLTNKCAVDVVLSWKFRTNHLILFKKNLEDLQWLAISNDASRRTRKKTISEQLGNNHQNPFFTIFFISMVFWEVFPNGIFRRNLDPCPKELYADPDFLGAAFFGTQETGWD